MRRSTILLCAAPVLALLAGIACGSKPPEVPHDTTQTSVSGGPAAPDSAGNPTTTTPPVADAGAGTKLEPTTSGDAGGAPGHVSDPGRSVKDIQAIIQARREEARACYEKAYKKDPSIGEGDIDVRWVIDPMGNVTEIDVDPSKTTIMGADTGKCIIEIIKKIKFNKSDRGFETKTHYPFNFKKPAAAAKDAGAK